MHVSAGRQGPKRVTEALELGLKVIVSTRNQTLVCSKYMLSAIGPSVQSLNLYTCCLFVCLWTGLILQPWLASNSQSPAGVYLQSAGLEGVPHHIQLHVWS